MNLEKAVVYAVILNALISAGIIISFILADPPYNETLLENLVFGFLFWLIPFAVGCCFIGIGCMVALLVRYSLKSKKAIYHN